MEWDNTLRKGYRVVGGVLPRHLGRHLLFLRYIGDRHANHIHDIVARRIGDPATVYADPTAAEALLGWTAQLTLDDIIRTAYAWHASQVAHQ